MIGRRINKRRVYVEWQTIGISSDKYDMNLALTLLRKMPDITVVRMVEKGDQTIIEAKGSRDDVAQFIGTYNTKLSEKLSRESPELSYDEIKSRFI